MSVVRKNGFRPIQKFLKMNFSVGCFNQFTNDLVVDMQEKSFAAILVLFVCLKGFKMLLYCRQRKKANYFLKPVKVIDVFLLVHMLYTPLVFVFSFIFRKLVGFTEWQLLSVSRKSGMLAKQMNKRSQHHLPNINILHFSSKFTIVKN